MADNEDSTQPAEGDHSELMDLLRSDSTDLLTKWIRRGMRIYVNTSDNFHLSTSKMLLLESLQSRPSNDLESSATGSSMGKESSTMQKERHIICCVCKLVPMAPIFQCSQGHLYCGGCYQIRVLDKTLGDALGTCGQCSVRIYRHELTRNIVAEEAVNAYIVKCPYCNAKMKLMEMKSHLSHCLKRLVNCSYRRLGCNWKGEYDTLEAHVETCAWANKKGIQLYTLMNTRNKINEQHASWLGQIHRLLQRNHMTVRVFQFSFLFGKQSFSMNEFNKVFSFTAFNQRWSLQLMWQTLNKSKLRLGSMTPSSLLYHLNFESQSSTQLVLYCFIVPGQYSTVEFEINLQKGTYSDQKNIGPISLLYFNTYNICSKLLEKNGIYGRLFMILE